MDALSQDKVEFIISLARELGEESLSIMGEELGESNEPHHYSEFSLAAAADGSTHEDFAKNSAYHELVGAINSMNENERSELVALMWVGRGTYSKSEWETALDDAQEASNNHTAEYMMRETLLPDYLTEGLAIMVDED